MLGDEPLEVRDELAAASGSQVAVEQRLPREQAALLEPRRLGLGEGLTREVGERRPAPECERLARAACGEQPLELPQVDELLRLGEGVAGGSGDEDAVAEDPAELRDEVVERPDRGGGRAAAPELVHQPVDGHGLPGPEEQRGEQRPLLAAR